MKYITTKTKTIGLNKIFQMKDIITPIIPNVICNMVLSSLKTPEIKNKTRNIQNSVRIMFFIILILPPSHYPFVI